MNLFQRKTKEQKADEEFAKKLTDTILKSDNLKALAAQARKQWEFEALQTQPLNYPIIQDLVNSAVNGVIITINFTDGNQVTMKADPNHTMTDADKAEQLRRLNQREYF